MSALPPVQYLRAAATFSPDKRYRYQLLRVWNDALPLLIICMLNPSKAGGIDVNGLAIDDPTIRKCVGFARRLGYGGIIVVNAFAWCATDPDELFLRTTTDPVGRENDSFLRSAAEMGDVLVAWGTNVDRKPWSQVRAKAVLQILRESAPSGHVLALKLSQDGIPCHPLMLPYALRPVVFAGSHA